MTLCLFPFCRFLRQGHPLGTAPKKSLARQVGWAASLDVAPISGRSGDDAAAALVNSTAAVVAPVPLSGQVGTRAEGAPLEVAEQMVIDLALARSLLQVESNELDVLKVALGVICDDLQVVQAEGTSSLVARAVDIMAWVR